MSDSQKICHICGEDCAGRPRTKDKKGRYYCQPCYDAALEKRRAAKAAAAAPPPPPEPEAFDNMFVELAAASESAAPPTTMGAVCPGCGAGLGESAVICTNCGYNRESGKKLRVKKTKAPKERGEGSRDVAAWLLHPLAFSVAYCVIYFVLLGLLVNSRAPGGEIMHDGNAVLVLTWFGMHATLVLVVNLAVLVLAFREGIGTGLLTLCIPCYVLYFVYGICQNTWVQYAFTVYLIVSVAGLLPVNLFNGV